MDGVIIIKKLLFIVMLFIAGVTACTKKTAQTDNKYETYHKEEEDNGDGSADNSDEDASEAVEFSISPLSETDNEIIQKLLQDFTEAAKKKDWNTVEPFFAMDKCIDGYNMEAAKETFGENAKRPSKKDRIDKVSGMYILYVLGFALDAYEIDNLSAVELDADTINDLIEVLDLDQLNILRFDTPMEENCNTESYKNMIGRRCYADGAENIAYQTILYELGGKTFYCGFSLYKYDGEWMINELSCGGLTYVDSYTVTMQCSEEDYFYIIGMEDSPIE